MWQHAIWAIPTELFGRDEGGAEQSIFTPDQTVAVSLVTGGKAEILRPFTNYLLFISNVMYYSTVF